MEEKNNTMPELTLTPSGLGLELEGSAAAAAELVLETSKEEAFKPIEERLTPEEKAAVHDFSQKIDITNSTQILQYGVTAQRKISGFSESALNNVRGKDLGEVGLMIQNLVTELKGFGEEEKPSGIMGFFKKTGRKMEDYKAKYTSVEKNVDRIVNILEGHKVTLLKDVAMLDKMYDMNLAYYKELTLYIMAGKEKLALVQDQELPAAQQKARETGAAEDAQTANYLADMCNRFDKKLHDLDLTRMICIQMGPQIRLVQSNDSMMVEKIQSSIVNTIPLWKNQMVLTLGLAHSQDAIMAQRQVTDITNELLRKNADALKIATVETAKESERGIVDIETLQHTNSSLIQTLDEVMRIQDEGRAKRRAAEQELQRIEGELKNKLLEIRDNRAG
jgi:uncharacterized protein YaaN involved in tellurite resistance